MKRCASSKLLEEYGYGFFEEPVHFDWYEETKQVADAVNIPVAGGEQEYSLHGFRWLIANNGLSDCPTGQLLFRRNDSFDESRAHGPRIRESLYAATCLAEDSDFST